MVISISEVNYTKLGPLILGMITMPFSLSTNERLLWLQVWIDMSVDGIKHDKRNVDLCFSYQKDLDESMKYLIKESDWLLVGLTKMMTPEGIYVRFFYDQEYENLINQYK